MPTRRTGVLGGVTLVPLCLLLGTAPAIAGVPPPGSGIHAEQPGPHWLLDTDDPFEPMAWDTYDTTALSSATATDGYPARSTAPLPFTAS